MGQSRGQAHAVEAGEDDSGAKQLSGCHEAQMCYEAERRRVEGFDGASGGLRREEGETVDGSLDGQSAGQGAAPGSTGVEQERELGDNRSGSTGIEQERELGDNRSGEDAIRLRTHGTERGWASVEKETPAKRQRLGNVCETAKPQEVREGAAPTQWEKREELTVLCRETPPFLEVSEVIKLIGTPLTTLIGAIKHMAKRAVPVKAGGTEIEAIAAPTIADVLESSWKWDGQGEQPEWKPDSVRFRQLFPTYQAWHTLAYSPSVLAQMVSLPPEHRVFTELGERIQASMRAGWPSASYGPVPDAPRPLMQTDKTSFVRRWYLHTLAEASLYGAPHDGRLHKALRQELQGTFDPYNSILWIGPGWPPEGRMESVRVFTGEEAEQRVNVWLWQRDEYSEWSVIAIQGPLTALGRFSEYGVLPGAVACKRCGESHVKGCRSRFLPACFRWTDTVRHRRGQDGKPMWMLCEAAACGQLPVSELCVCGRKSRLVPDFGSGIAVKSFDVTRVMEHRRNWFKRVPNIDAMCRHILVGGAYIPTIPGGIQPQMRANLGSVGYDRPGTPKDRDEVKRREV